MTNFRQTLHVMVKDIREHQVVIVIYLGVVALTTVTAAARGGDTGFPTSLLLVALLEVLGMIVAASFVQSDSPTRADAFWASRPFDPSAILGAKFLETALIVLVVPVTGELIALIAHHAEAGILFRAAATTGWAYATWLIVAFLSAAMTRDIKSFIMTIATVPILLVALVVWTAARAHSTDQEPALRSAAQYATSWCLIFLGALGSAALLTYLYRTRDARPRTWVAGLACVFLLAQSPGRTLTRAEASDAVPNTPRTTFRVSTGTTSNNGANEVRYGINVSPDSLPPMQRLALLNGVVTLRGRAGSTVKQAVDNPFLNLAFSARPIDGVTWLGHDLPISGAGVGVTRTDSLRAIVEGGITDVRIDGRILVRVPGRADTLNLRVGATVARNGTSMTISKLDFSGGEPTLELAVSSVPEAVDPTGPYSMDDQTDFSLVNGARREAVALMRRGGGHSFGWLVLAGIQVSAGEEQLGRQFMRRPGVSDEPLRDDWFDGARLVITHWVPAGSYTIHAENAKPSQFPPAPPRPK